MAFSTSPERLRTLPEYVLRLSQRKKAHCLSVLNRVGDVKQYSSFSYFDQIQRLTRALVDSGIKRTSRVALISNTRHEWSVCELATICAGGVIVPIYPNTTTEDLLFILNHSECEFVFVENRLALRQVMVVRDQCPKLRNVIVFEPPPQQEPGLWMSLMEFMSGGAQTEHPSFSFERLCQTADERDAVTILYTSGTTGQPKGVVLSHQQIINETLEVFAALQISSKDHTLSFLPYSHVLGRTEHWGHLIVGYSMTYSSGVERLVEEMAIVNPTVIVGVPRIFEKLYSLLKSKIETSTIDQTLFEWGYEIGSRVSFKQEHQESLTLRERAEWSLAQKVVLGRLKEQIFGSRLRFAVSGGAPLSLEILKFFHACGVLILEGYGLTETTGAICVNRPYLFEFGTVGKPLFRTKIKIAEDGEILVKGPTTMLHYYKDSEATEEILNDSWIATGDIGAISERGALIIKDRKKDLIKSSNGKYIAPQKIEGFFKEMAFISNVHIHGDNRKYVVALLTLNKQYLFSYAREKDIAFNSMEDLKEAPPIKAMIREGVAKVNAKLPSHETIKNYAVLPDDFTVESGEITPSLKVKRRIVDQKFAELIESLYTI